MSAFHDVILAGASGSQGYNISRSVRLRSSASAYFNRTPASATDRKTWTWSGWVKKSNATTGGTLFAARTGAGATYLTVVMSSAGDFRIESNSETSYPLYKTNALFRDPAAWYHFVVALDMTQATSTNRLKVWVNGVLQTTASYNVPAQNTNLAVNTTETHLIGQQASGSYFDGYMTEINFIDGQALTPSSFGETDAVTGVWKPKKFAGTYGTNGFYLNFSDNSNNTATTIGKDYSGNGNNWTPNNISVTAGVTYDSMLDTPTPYADGGTNRGNYCTLSPLQIGPYAALSAGNLRVTGNSATNSAVSLGTFSPTSGKWYWEVTQGTLSSEFIGVMTKTVTGESLIDGSALAQTLGKGVVARYNGAVRGISGELQLTTTSTWTSGDIIQLAVDLDNGAVYFGKNGTWLNSGVPTSGSSKTGSFLNFTQDGTRCCTPACDAFNGGYVDANFGQRPFAYTPPTGFKALNTQNLPAPSILKGNAYFDATLYTGTGSSLSITNSGSMQPDLVWVKGRSGATDHALYDAVRGVQKQLESNTTTAETTETTGLTAFNSNGFTVGALAQMNTSSATYVGWQWKESASAGFDIVTYTGNATSGRTVSHSLGVAPSMVIVKNRSTATNWIVWHSGIANTEVLKLNLTDAKATDTAAWNSTTPSSSVLTLGSSTGTNGSGNSLVAYLFAEVAGFSKFGSYTGNGSTDGPFVFCGFRPRYIMIKESSSTGSWVLLDTSRSPYNVSNNASLWANLSDAEGGAAAYLDILSNGFKIRDTDSDKNTSSQTYIFAAFAEFPFRNSLAR